MRLRHGPLKKAWMESSAQSGLQPLTGKGSLWKDLEGSDEAKLCAAVHDEVLLLVREGLEQRWAHLLKQAMERAEAQWLGPIPAVADVKVGKTWQECH